MTAAPARSRTPSRRAAVREATLVEIRAHARALLVAEGEAGVTLRPIARALGLTAPALYRYYASRDELLLDLIADLYDELAVELETARDKVPADDLAGRFVRVTQQFRQWSRTHPPEFQLVFANPVGSTVEHAGPDRFEGCASRVGGVFLGLFFDLWANAPFAVRSDDDLDPRHRAQLAAWAAEDAIPLPLGALALYLECWVQIYGLISLEVIGHLKFAVNDVSPMFDTMVADLGARLGLAWRPEFSSP